jgi:hypothetical protein
MNIKTCIIFLLLIVFAPVSHGDADSEKIRIAFFPFNDVNTKNLNETIPAVLKGELSSYGFIESIPVEIVVSRLYEIEPLSMWSGREGDVDEGGIFWRIMPETVETVSKNISADKYIHGNITTFGSAWRIDINISDNRALSTEKVISKQGATPEEIPQKLEDAAKEIARWLGAGHAVSKAEENIRRYLGGMISYSEAIKSIKKSSDFYPESVPLHALLLDLYVKDEKGKKSEIINEGLAMLEMFDPSQEEEVRYILSLSMDPFDIVARNYEKDSKWSDAIGMRKEALKRFPFKSAAHKKKLGEDYFFYAQLLEKKGQFAKASDFYGMSLEYISETSEYFKLATEGLGRTGSR